MADSPDVNAGNLRIDQLARLESFGTRRKVAVGDELFAAGDESYNFYVVMAGAVDIIMPVDGVDEVIVTHTAGRFIGELNLLTGSRVYLTAAWRRPGRSSRSPRRRSAGSSPPFPV